MSVLIRTNVGEIEICLFTRTCPRTTFNFLKLCKINYYDGCLFHTILKNCIAQTGDPTGNGDGGDSIWKLLENKESRSFGNEIHPSLYHTRIGEVAMASGRQDLDASQFYITLGSNLRYLDGKHTVFGRVIESGLKTLDFINRSYLDEDEDGRLYRVRIRHIDILADPFKDPNGLSSLINRRRVRFPAKKVGLKDKVHVDEQNGVGNVVVYGEEVWSLLNHIHDADFEPPTNMLFVSLLNPITKDQCLINIFSRFGEVLSAMVIRDFHSGGSLGHAFIQYKTYESFQKACFEMNTALIHGRKVLVESASRVSKQWAEYKRKEHQTGSGCFRCTVPFK